MRGELVASEGMERIEKAAAKAIIGTEQLVEKLRASQVGMFNVNVMWVYAVGVNPSDSGVKNS